VRMAVDARRLAVGGPAGVSNTAMGHVGSIGVGLGLVDQLLQLRNFSDLLVGKNLTLLVTVYSHSGGIIATVFEAGET